MLEGLGVVCCLQRIPLVDKSRERDSEIFMKVLSGFTALCCRYVYSVVATPNLWLMAGFYNKSLLQHEKHTSYITLRTKLKIFCV
jgi:hypothetical protein